PARPDPVAPTPGTAAALHWTTPAEVPPLPPLELEVGPVPLVLPGDAGWTVTGRSGPAGAPFAAARALGAGRVAVLGLPGSCLWRMEGGAVEEHRAFWRGWADWAAGGVPDGPLVSIPAGVV